MGNKNNLQKTIADEKFLKQLEAQNSALKKIIKKLKKQNKATSK